MIVSIGKLLRSKRNEKGYTLEDIAEKIGVSINYVSKIEKGESTNPSDEIIVNLSRILDIEEDYVFKSFGRIPLKTRTFLEEHTDLSDAISKIGACENINDSDKEEFLSKITEWCERVSKKKN